MEAESKGAIEIDPWDSGLIAGEESRLGGQFSKNKVSVAALRYPRNNPRR